MAVSLGDVTKLNPEGNSDIALALTFLRLVVKNNPNRTLRELEARPDVQSAMESIDNWLREADRIVAQVIVQSPLIPNEAVPDVKRAVRVTLTRFRNESRLDERNLQEWKQTPDESDAWTARLILRMGWFVRFLMGLLSALDGAHHKTWNSRLAPNTCTYCRRLHGVTIGISESFAPAAKAAGWARIYGGLYAPPLHPNCQCFLSFSV